MQFNRLHQGAQIALQQHMAMYGYELADTPVIDSADLFLTKAGDQLISKLFTFERHGRQLALRPEFTAGATYRYVHQIKTGIARWQFAGAVFQDDPGRHDHNYQYASMGAELFGMEEPLADAEVIAMAAQGLQLLNVSDLVITIGHIGLLRHLIRKFSLDIRSERFLLNNRQLLREPSTGRKALLDRFEQMTRSRRIESGPEAATSNQDEQAVKNMLDIFFENRQLAGTMGGRSRDDVVRRLLQKQKQASELIQFEEAVNFLTEWTAITGETAEAFRAVEALIPPEDGIAHQLLNRWKQTLDLLKAHGIPDRQVRIQPELARSWDYYTGIVFELRGAGKKVLAAGGRYDELAQLIGSPRTVPAVGFAYYLDEILSGGGPLTTELAVVLVVTSENASIAVQWASILRARQIHVSMMPPKIPLNGEVVISIDETGSAILEGRDYTLEEADALIQRIGEVNS